MKRTLSVAALTPVAAFVAGVMFLLPPTVPPEVIERSVIHEQTLLEKAWRLPNASAFGHHVDFQSNQSLCGPASSLTFFVLSASQQIPRKRFLLIRQSAGPASAFLDYLLTNSPTRPEPPPSGASPC